MRFFFQNLTVIGHTRENTRRHDNFLKAGFTRSGSDLATAEIAACERRLNPVRGGHMKCKAITRAGLPCPAAAGANGLCYFHANPQRAQKLGQMGGWKNRRRPAVELHIPYNLSASDLGR